MEARKITVVSTRDQKRTVIMSEAETLGQLKQDLNNHNIDYTDMAFYEGTAKVELHSDESVLPHDVPYKGNTTNELVFMLTNSNKKIKSGATRLELYAVIKDNNLQEDCENEFGKNYTNCKTAELEDFVSRVLAPEQMEEKVPARLEDVVNAVTYLAELLEESGYITTGEMQEAFDILGVDKESKSEIQSSYSEDEIDEMFKDMQ